MIFLGFDFVLIDCLDTKLAVGIILVCTRVCQCMQLLSVGLSHSKTAA
jgi:hypothetical protein